MVCKYDALDIDLSSGQIADAEFEEVPFIRFTKSMSTRLTSSSSPTDLGGSVRENQRTVFVMNVDSLSTTLLGKWSFDSPAMGEPWPWELPVWNTD